MPVEFLSDEQASRYGCYEGPPSRTELEGVFFLDDADRALVVKRRGDHNRLGFALQLATVRYLGTFLADPLDVPQEALDFLAEQLHIADPSCVKAYTERAKTRFEHAWEIQREYGLRDFAEADAELEEWVDAQAWTTGDGPKALFDGAVVWLRKRKVLLPGVTTLARLVARVRDAASQRLWDTICGLLAGGQSGMLERLLVVQEGARHSDLDRLRNGPARVSGPEMVRALERVAEIEGLGLGGLDLSGLPPRRVEELARYGLSGKASLLRRHPDSRRLATLAATAVELRGRAVDDVLELFDVLMVTNLLARAERESNHEKLRRLPRFSRESAKLAAALEVLFDVTESGNEVGLDELWQRIESVVSRTELASALSAIVEMAPPGAEDVGAEWRAELIKRYATVRRFLPTLTETVRFGSTADGEPVLDAMRSLPELIGRRKLSPGDVADEVVSGSWRRLVYDTAGLGEGVIDKSAYVFCVLESFHRHLRRRDIFAPDSGRWADPRAKLLAGDAWAKTKGPVLASLQLPETPDGLLQELAVTLDVTYREVGGRLAANTAVDVDADGKLHLGRLKAIPDPASLVELRHRIEAMLPRVDLPELILEVMAWVPEFPAAFVSVTGGDSRLADLHVSIAALLVARGCNLGFRPVARSGVATLTRERLSHVDQNYLRPETFKAANAPLVEYQASLPLARAWGGGLVASVDGVRFVVPVRTIHARPNPRCFGRGRGATWLNMVNDQAAGLAGMVVSGTPRDSLHTLDVIYSQVGGPAPTIITTDTGSYSDVMFGLVHLLGRQYRPQLADIPDQKLWHIDPNADYGALRTVGRGRINLARIRSHWDDMVRVAASIHTGAVRAYDVIRMLQRDGNPTPLGHAIAHYGRIFKTLHVLTYADDESYRRAIKGQNNLGEGRHALARRVFHGQRGELRHRYVEGMEDQLGALGLLLNCITLWMRKVPVATASHSVSMARYCSAVRIPPGMLTRTMQMWSTSSPWRFRSVRTSRSSCW